MDRPDLPLNALRVFEVAMRQGNFTRAAIELRVSQAAVSHQIARLEDRLGTALFLRTSAGLVATDEGRALFPVVEHALDTMGRALDRITGQHDVEVLKLGVVTTFAVGWLLPRLSEFHRCHPDIEVRVSTHNNRVEILREGLDMAIRFGAGQWTGLDSVPLLQTPLAPLCAPEIAARLQRPEDLGRAPLLRSYRSDEWPRWFATAGLACPALTGPTLDSSVALADLAERGDGVALLPVEMFRQRIDARRLVQPFSATVSTGRYYLSWPSDRPLTPAMSVFTRWIRQMCEA